MQSSHLSYSLRPYRRRIQSRAQFAIQWDVFEEPSSFLVLSRAVERSHDAQFLLRDDSHKPELSLNGCQRRQEMKATRTRAS